MTTTTNPYVGPRSFERSEKLYGRDRELRQLTDRLIAERIVLLHSPSGAGKTSLVQAGLIPQLGEENFFVHSVIRVNQEGPADLVKITETLRDPNKFNRYTFSTLLSLEERYPAEERMENAHLARMTLDDYLNFRAKEDKRSGPEFLIFDQFEEVLTIDPTDRASKNAFFTQLGTALKNRDRWALFAMRTDFVGALEPYVRMVPTFFSNTFHLELLGVKSAREAIQQPARQAGVDFTDGAASKLVDDLRRVQVQLIDGTTESQLGLYVEPVQLQVVCYRLWEGKADDDMDINETDLASVGDVNQSLAEYYSMSIARVAQATGATERSIREWFDRKLITPEGIRSQVRMGAEVSEGLPNAAVRKIEDSHLIRAEKRAGQTWYELAHDRLIEPVRNDNKHWFESNLSLFQRQASLWQEQGRSEGLLLRNQELSRAEKESTTLQLTAEERDFLEACRALKKREERDRNQRRMILGAAVISFVLFLAALYSWNAAFDANQAFVEQANIAQTEQARAILAQNAAEAASTEAYQQKATAEAASQDALNQKATAEAERAIAQQNAAQAATARAEAEIEKNKALEQEKLAIDRGIQAQASELVAQSLLIQDKNEKLGLLLAIEAFKIRDNARTRRQLLGFLRDKSRLLWTQAPGTVTGTAVNVGFTANNQVMASSNFFECGEKENRHYLCQQGLVKFWQINSQARQNNQVNINVTQAATFAYEAGVLDAIIVSPDGKTVAAAFCNPNNSNIIFCEDENIILLDAATYKQIGTPVSVAQNTRNDRNILLTFSPDGSQLAIAVDNNSIILLDAATLTAKAKIAAQAGIAQMAFSPDNASLLFVDGGSTSLAVVNVATQAVETLKVEGSARPLLSLTFSPDATTLAVGTADGSIFLLDAKTYQVSQKLLDRQSKVASLAFSPDGKVLAAGYEDFNMAVWDMETRQTLFRSVFNHNSLVYSLSFSPDGKMLASSGTEINLWDFDPASWLNKACDIAGANFSQAEWDLYFFEAEYQVTCPQWPAGK